MNWLQFKIKVYEKFVEPYIVWPFRAKSQKRNINRLRSKDSIKVVFYAMNISMWNYQHLYDLMKQNSRFLLYIIISPNCLSPKELRLKDALNLKKYFDERCISYVDCDSNGEVGINVRKDIAPDIVFYTQPYPSVMKQRDYCMNFQDKLICYYPYAFWSANGDWSYNKELHRIAWKLFYSTDLHYKDAKKYCLNHGRNVIVTGYPKTDDFLQKEHTFEWKIKERNYKRLIWAPHFTLSASIAGTVPRSNFLLMADLMVSLAIKYKDRLQIAFKPHPLLKRELYKLETWGKNRTDSYYNLWNTMPNTFVDEGEYIDLFMTSDGMVHDCSSFSIEYHYSQKPVMYVSQDIEAYKRMLNNFGKMAIDLHYIGKTKNDVIEFIEKQVFDGSDPLKEKRIKFYNDYLVPSHGMSVAQYTYNDIITSLGI